MKRQILITAVSALILPAFSQTNEMRRGEDEIPDIKQEGKVRQESKRSERRGEPGGRKYKERYREMSPEEKAERQERRLQLMEKTLKEIGVTEEQREKINELQKKLRTDMELALKKASETRRKLSELEKNNAPEDQVFAAIDAVSAASATQMKIIARNKMAMKRILGDEKYRQFMDAARDSYRTHGHRGGDRMPPRPKLPSPPLPAPPIPNTSRAAGNTPPPPV